VSTPDPGGREPGPGPAGPHELQATANEQLERVLELSRRLRAVVHELGNYSGEAQDRAMQVPDSQLLPEEGRAELAAASAHAPAALADERHGASENGSAEVSDQQPRAGSRSSRIMVNAGFRAVADIGSKLATAILYIVIARKLGASQFGVYAFALSFVTLITMLGFFGQDVVLTREVARDYGRLDEYYANAMLSRAMFSIPPLLIALAVLSAAGMSGHTRLVILLLGLAFTAEYMVQIPFAVFQAYERVSLVTIVLVTQRWVTTTAAVAALYLGAGLIPVMAIFATGAAGGVLLGTWMLYRKIARPRLRIDFSGALRVTRESLPIGIALVALAILFRINVSMLAAFKPSRDVGQYGAVYRLLETTAFVSWAVNVALLPSLSRLSMTSTPTVGSVYQRGLKLVIAITLPMSIGAAVLAGPIISLLYGAQYHPAAKALVLLAPTIALFPIASLSSQLFFAQGRRPTVALVYAAVAVENILVNLILIPRYSYNGAAVGTSISEVLVTVALIWLARGMRGKLELRRMLVGPALGSVAAGAVMLALHAHLIAAVAFGVAAYFAVLFAYERIAFPDDFSVVQVLVGQLRARLARAPAQGEAV
jgi:O-antigen/teichoic acid export membrane protein